MRLKEPVSVFGNAAAAKNPWLEVLGNYSQFFYFRTSPA